jgi:N-methylhydantoinase A
MMHIGVDAGGTFTDLASFDPVTRSLTIRKVASNPQDPVSATMKALQGGEAQLSRVTSLVHSTTVATNAVLERKGVKCGLITTKGFRDVLELRRRDRPHLFGLRGTYMPLVTRDLRLEVDERVSADGVVVKKPTEQEIREVSLQ